jgi:hypothetical protein
MCSSFSQATGKERAQHPTTTVCVCVCECVFMSLSASSLGDGLRSVCVCVCVGGVFLRRGRGGCGGCGWVCVGSVRAGVKAGGGFWSHGCCCCVLCMCLCVCVHVSESVFVHTILLWACTLIFKSLIITFREKEGGEKKESSPSHEGVHAYRYTHICIHMQTLAIIRWTDRQIAWVNKATSKWALFLLTLKNDGV